MGNKFSTEVTILVWVDCNSDDCLALDMDPDDPVWIVVAGDEDGVDDDDDDGAEGRTMTVLW